MDNRPIGVFDSGLGGLTTLRELAALLPHEQLIYFGDTARVPYGGRSKETLIKYAQQDVAFLSTFNLKAIVIACGTVSTTAFDVLVRTTPIPILGVVEPAAQAAAFSTQNNRIGLIATSASIRTGAYERQITTLNPTAQIFAKSCPLFVPLVENGHFRPGDIVIETIVEEYLSSLKAVGVDTLVLGCTHYPLLREVIGSYMGPDVTLVDVGAECARETVRRLTRGDQLADTNQTGGCRFFVSDSTEGFSSLASIFLHQEVGAQVEQIDINRY